MCALEAVIRQILYFPVRHLRCRACNSVASLEIYFTRYISYGQLLSTLLFQFLTWYYQTLECLQYFSAVVMISKNSKKIVNLEQL